MGLIAKMLEYVIGDKSATIKADPGGGYNITMPHFSPAGDDSQPLANDVALGVETQRTGQHAVAGYQDSYIKPKAAEGEKRIYARKPDGTQIAEVWLKNTGEMVISNPKIAVTISDDGGLKIDNGNGTLEVEPSGVIKMHGIEVSPSDIIDKVKEMLAEAVTASKSLSVNSIEVHAHTHNVTAVGSPTGPMLTGTPVP